MSHSLVYPFSAVVGQTSMKRALILAAIHPGLGGVLIRGSKGAAKSTSVRALAGLLPPIEVYEGDPFHRAPGELVEGWPLAVDVSVKTRQVSLINLPVGSTDDRIVGSLNLERALATGTRAFEPGLLARAHRGLLYIDEVNLLGDHLVDLLLDASAMGVNHVEREGLSFEHPSRFVLVGTMNPEEGDLRPQLLDRFGLAVDVEPMADPRQRAEVVRRRLAFEADPAGFRAHWAETDSQEGDRIIEARRILPSVIVPSQILDAICSRCAAEGADGLRADLTIYKAASALAAYHSRTTVTLEDVEAVAELALVHRRTTPPPPRAPSPPPPRQNNSEPARSESRDSRTESDRDPQPSPSASQDAPTATTGDNGHSTERSEASDPMLAPLMTARAVTRTRQGPDGRRGKRTTTDRQGVAIRSSLPRGPVNDLALFATLKAATPWQGVRGREEGGRLILRGGDFRVKVRVRPTRHLILFVVDASRSMGARKRMSQTKASVLGLLVDAYQKRDQVGLIAFSGTSARLALAPTRSVQVAASQLAEMPVGGTTPLAHGLLMAEQVVERSRRRAPGVVPMVVVLTDGRGNVPIVAGNDPTSDALVVLERLRRGKVDGLMIDTEAGPVRLGMATALARAWGVECRTLEDRNGRSLPDAVRKALFRRIA